MNLFYEEFPKAVIVSGIEVPIVTDFREYIKMLDMLKDPDVSNEEKTYFLADYFTDKIPDFNEAVKQLSDFVLMKSFATTGIDVEIEEKEETREEKHLFSFEIDYPYILSGFLRDYGIDLSSVRYLHWWKFRMLFDGLSDDTEIKQRIMYRSLDLSTIKDKDERKRIQKIQRSIQLPQEALSDYDIGDMFA